MLLELIYETGAPQGVLEEVAARMIGFLNYKWCALSGAKLVEEDREFMWCKDLCVFDADILSFRF